VNGAEKHVPGSISISFRGVDGEMLLHRLDLMGIAVATGSACNSKDTVLSHVIKAIAVPEAYAKGTIRITLGMDNNEEQVDKIVAALRRILTWSL
jgi:cysteine desulfurase